MDEKIKEYYRNLSSTDDKIRMDALQNILRITEEKVVWVYEVWDDLLLKLDDPNSYQRSIAIMVLCNLARSDWENRLEGSLHRLLAHTRDEKFITSRQCLQNVWKIAVAHPGSKMVILEHLAQQFASCEQEKHYNLIRQDIISSMKMIYESTLDVDLPAKTQELIKLESEKKYQKKYEDIFTEQAG